MTLQVKQDLVGMHNSHVKSMPWLVAAALAAGVLAFATQGSAWHWPDRWHPWAPVNIDEPPNWLTRFKLRRLSDDADQCRAVLSTSALRFDVLADRRGADGCELLDVVRVHALAQTKIGGSAIVLSCRAAVSLALWERHSLLPQAQRLLGAPARTIEHFGSHACRNVYGREDGRRSQHASADALDVAGFVIGDGRRISVARDWHGDDAAARYLRAVHADACRFFDAAFSPDYNAAHADHLHLDRGPYRVCR
jgi:hypothetical protein